MKPNILYIAVLFLLSAVSCLRPAEREWSSECRYAELFDIVTDSVSAKRSLVVFSPSGDSDTMVLDRPLGNIICMSSSHVAALSAIGADHVISAVSGLGYISSPAVRSRCRDIGYEHSLDLEAVMQISPDLLVTYTVSGIEPPYIGKLRSMGVRVLVLNDHLEHHPLARAEYMRLFGALTGRLPQADSLFNIVCRRYEALRTESDPPVDVLLNIPYGDAWYVPGAESYMSVLVRDAGGRVLGASEGSSSGIISLEDAYRLSQEAELWLNPGHCRTREALGKTHPLFPSFGPLANGKPIYNNVSRVNSAGGNDFYESGAVRPDLVLEDLVRIFSHARGYASPDSLNYYIPL